MPLFRRKRHAKSKDSKPSDPTVDFSRQAEQLIPAEVLMISGCRSEQTSADVSNVTSSVGGNLPKPAGRSGGACTSALLGLLYEKHDQKLTFQQVLLDLRQSLVQSGFDQIPQLTSSRPLELKNTPYSLVKGGGARRALLVGINYVGQSGQLNGCINDVLNMKKYIIEKQGYLEHNIIVLIDKGTNESPPTREIIISSLKWLVAQSESGDSVYFHYSGHGGLLPPEWNIFKKNNSAKEYDETLYPMDHDQKGQIRDFSLFNHFVKPMAAGVTVTCVMDCCHSGSVLNLPYTYKPTRNGKISVQHSIDSLSNLAFLYILAGGMLPPGFDDIANNIEDIAGGGIDEYYGLGIEEMANDASTSDHISGYLSGEGTKVHSDGFETRFARSEVRSQDSETYIPRSQDSETYIARSQDSQDGETYITRAQDSQDGETFVTRAQESQDGETFVTRAEESQDGETFITRVEESQDGETFITRAEESQDGETFITRAQESQDEETFIAQTEDAKNDNGSEDGDTVYTSNFRDSGNKADSDDRGVSNSSSEDMEDNTDCGCVIDILSAFLEE